MDVLQIIKSDHTKIRGLLQQLETAQALKARRSLVKEFVDELLMHLHLEESYLYPEVSGLFPESEAFVSVSLANHAVFRKECQKLTKLVELPLTKQLGFEKLAVSLSAKINSHFLVEEEIVMPQMRKLIPTQDREDLGVVFQDVKSEGVVPETPTSKARKRA